MERTSTDVGRRRPQVEGSLETTLRRFNEAFNRFDAKEVASFWTDDGTLYTPVGEYAKGRAGVATAYQHDVESILDGTTSKFTITGARKIGEDCALLDLDHELQNFTRPDGSTGSMKLHTVILAQKTGDGWKWLDARPYAFLPPPQRTH
jgi:uncharacterized protein (TIGR02246 family)